MASSDTTLIDLTLAAREGMRGISYESAATVQAQGWNARMLHLYSHSGTHMDAPYHFEWSDKRIDQILLGAEIVIVEGLTNLDRLSSDR